MSLAGYIITSIVTALSYYGCKLAIDEGYVREFTNGTPYSTYQNFDFELGTNGWIVILIVFFFAIFQSNPRKTFSPVLAGIISGALLTSAYVIVEVSWLQFNTLETEWFFWTAWLAAIASGASAVALNKSK